MSERIRPAVVAGVLAGVVMGIMMTVMSAPTPDGGSMPMMAMVAQVIGSSSLVAGWAYHLFNSAVIGALFGLLLGSQAERGTGAALVWGAGYGIVWWVLGGLILMPMFLGMPAFAPLLMAPMRGVAMASLMGHLVFGLLLGWLYLRLRSQRGARAVAV